jgi:hypothetical protein
MTDWKQPVIARDRSDLLKMSGMLDLEELKHRENLF